MGMQMLVGMYVTIKAVFHQARGEECHVNKTNSVLGLGMYFSYFVLFFKLFLDNYCTKDSKKLSALPRKPSVSLEVVRKASEKVLDDMWSSSCFVCCVYHQILLRLSLSIFIGDVTNASHVGNARNSPLHKLACMLAEDRYPTLSRFFSRPFKALSCTGCSALTMYSKTMNTDSLFTLCSQ